ncbi:hypothetical protein [Streptomyces sp. NPDC102487]|uniref:hypothetical protein n=1 Tax=Streptomyces sp. NPDC102487 TaxID=3366182 RepID=UPI0037F52AF5
MTETPKTDDSMVAALLREREGYANRKGMEDRVAAVDEQLRLRGYAPDGERITQASVDDQGQGEGEGQAAAGKKPAQRSTPPKGRQPRGTEQA